MLPFHGSLFHSLGICWKRLVPDFKKPVHLIPFLCSVTSCMKPKLSTVGEFTLQTYQRLQIRPPPLFLPSGHTVLSQVTYLLAHFMVSYFFITSVSSIKMDVNVYCLFLPLDCKFHESRSFANLVHHYMCSAWHNTWQSQCSISICWLNKLWT